MEVFDDNYVKHGAYTLPLVLGKPNLEALMTYYYGTTASIDVVFEQVRALCFQIFIIFKILNN